MTFNATKIIPNLFMGVVSLAFHVVAIYYWFTSEPFLAASFFNFGQGTLALIVLSRINGGILLFDIRALFIMGLILYTSSFPIALIFERPEQMDVAADMTVLLCAFSFVGYNIGQCFRSVRISSEKMQSAIRVSRSKLFLGAWFAPAWLCVCLAYAAYFHVPFRLGGVMGSRDLDAGTMEDESAQLWGILNLIMVGIVCYNILKFRSFTNFGRLVSFLSIAVFVLFHSGLGNRRQFAGLLLVIFASWAARFKMRIGPIVCLALTSVIFVVNSYFGYIRQGDLLPPNTSVVEGMLTENEFSAPISTLYILLSDRQLPLQWGISYLRFPLYVIPRSLWSGKPRSLAVELIQTYMSPTWTQGLAYTPITEAYLNFGYAGPLIVFFCIALFLNWLVRNVDIHLPLYLALLSTIPDFHRSESGGFLYQLAFVILGMKVPSWIVRERSVNRHVAAADTQHVD